MEMMMVLGLIATTKPIPKPFDGATPVGKPVTVENRTQDVEEKEVRAKSGDHFTVRTITSYNIDQHGARNPNGHMRYEYDYNGKTILEISEQRSPSRGASFDFVSIRFTDPNTSAQSVYFHSQKETTYETFSGKGKNSYLTPEVFLGKLKEHIGNWDKDWMAGIENYIKEKDAGAKKAAEPYPSVFSEKPTMQSSGSVLANGAPQRIDITVEIDKTSKETCITIHETPNKGKDSSYCQKSNATRTADSKPKAVAGHYSYAAGNPIDGKGVANDFFMNPLLHNILPKGVIDDIGKYIIKGSIVFVDRVESPTKGKPSPAATQSAPLPQH